MRLIAEFAFIALLFLLSASFAQTNISSCQTISTNGSYILNQSITQVSGDCIPITASNVILDCNGSNITGLAGANNGISATSVSNITIENCPLVSNFQSGILFSTVYNSTITNSTAYSNSQIGFALYSSSNNTLTSNSAYNNTQSGFRLDINSNVSTLINNSGYNNKYGFLLVSSFNNTLLNNSAYNNSDSGFLFVSSSNNTLTNNLAYRNTQVGFYLYSSSNNNTLTNNSAYNNSDSGFLFVSSSNSNLAGNPAYNNSYGFYLYSSPNNTLTNNSAYNNSHYGLYITNSNLTNATNTHLFNNTLADFYVDTSGGSPEILYLTNMTIDSPLGNFTNYTSLTITDTVEANTAYQIKWTSNSSALPTSYISFAQKFVNISSVTGTVSIDSITWNWLNSELTGYNASHFELWKYNATNNWTMLNNTPNTSANTLSLTNMNPASDYGILDFANVSALKLDQTAFQPSPGGIVQFNITITNNGNVTLDPVLVNDVLPVNLTYLASSPPADTPGQTSTWNNMGPLSAGASTTIYLNATVNASAVNSTNRIINLTNYMNATGVTPDATTVAAENYANATVYYANDSVVKLNLTAQVASQGGIIQYQINVTNTGDVSLNITVNDTLDTMLTYNSTDTTPVTVNAPYVNWTITSLAPGYSQIILLNASVSTTPSGCQDTMNNVSIVGLPPNGNPVTANTSLTVPVCLANESVVKLNLTAQVASQGGMIQYEINVTNTGDVSLNITVNDTLDSMLSYNSTNTTPVTVNGQDVNWSITGLTPGASQIILLNASVSTTPSGCQDTINMLVVNGLPPNGNNVTATANLTVPVCLANVSAVKVAITPFPPSPGGLVQWSINISNPGQVALGPVFVTDTLPDGFEYAGALPAPTGISPDNMTMNWTNVGPVAAGDSVIILLNSTVGPAVANGTYFNNVTVIGTPPNGNDVSASDSAQVGVFAPAINILKTVNPSSALVGRNVTYALNISNTGSANLTVTVVDVLPFHVLFKGSDVPPTSYVGQIITWENITNLTPGSSFVINYNVSANATGVYSNNATATGVPPNGNNVSDSDSATFTATPIPSSGGGSEDKPMTLTDSFVCPGNEVIFNAASGSAPLPGVAIRVIYDDPPAFYVAGDLTTDSSGLANITLSSSGTYRIYAKRSGYRNVDADFDYTACLIQPECLSGQDCPADKQCVDQKCSPVQCQCGQVTDHSCLEYQCCSDSDCQSGNECKSNKCVPIQPKPECAADGDCGSGMICQSGKCVLKPPECTSDANCGTGKTCQEGTCVLKPGCTTDSDCASGYMCKEQKCVLKPAPPKQNATTGAGTSGAAGEPAGTAGVSGTTTPTQLGNGIILLLLLLLLLVIAAGGAYWYLKQKK